MRTAEIKPKEAGKTWNEIMEENSRGRSWKKQDLE